MEFEKEHKPPQDDGDPFTNLMFGKKRRAREEDNPIQTEEFPDHQEPSHAPQRDPWLFGANGTHTPPQVHNQIEHLLNQVDIILLMETVDEAVKTYKLYQPIFKDVSTYLRKFFKK